MSKKEKGLFLSKLGKNTSELNEDRISSIHESAKISYKRQIENVEMEIKNNNIAREEHLDLFSNGEMMKAADFDPDGFVKMDAETTFNIKRLELVLEALEERYAKLFA